MSKRLKKKKLRELYELMSVEMTEFDCAGLCAPHNDGVPFCCDGDQVVPALYRDEYRWHRKRSSFWKRMRCKSRNDKEIRSSIEDSGYAVAASCPGAAKCDRALRALVCRTYPFEPYLDEHGRLSGLRVTQDPAHKCPLTERQDVAFNREYLANSLKLWEELLHLFPEEQELFLEEARSYRERLRKSARPLVLYTPQGRTEVALEG